ncbi:hypothetical protein [Extibacter muris]|uniref:hypothetical protein n=1 Tax=Extibacter muris TaxID=1796622 RepID=UPI001D08FBB4|nr:hypothetical protein [Extibacter muris]MCB6202130.1 hypothetical protein [Extibacter muris]MCQ4662565.1 hypothetical protein [Extibacter muris]MCQ4693199.1 hypothetical protein [Extibacter muris]
MNIYRKLIKSLWLFLCFFLLFSAGFNSKAAESGQEKQCEDKTTASDDSVDSQDEESVMPRGPAQRISKYAILKIKGMSPSHDTLSENFDTTGQNSSDRYTIRAENKYSSESKLTFSVRQYGTAGSVSVTSPECTVTMGKTYSHVLGSDGGVVEFTQDYEIDNISPDTQELKIQCMVQTTYSGGAFRWIYRDLIIPISNNRPAVPETPEIVYDTNYPESYILTGTDDSMEYASFQNPYRTAYEWKPCTEKEIVLEPGDEEVFYLVRYKETENNEASNYKQLTLPKRREAPAVTLDRSNEVLSKLTTEMEYSIGGGDYIPVTQSMIDGGISDILDEITEDTVIMRIRYRAEGKPASADRIITLYKRIDMPQDIEFDPLTFKVNGVKKGMEYLVDSEDKWIAVTGSYIDLTRYGSSEREVVVSIRQPYTSTLSNSKSYKVTLPKLKDAPTGLEIDYNEEVIKGFDEKCKYQYAVSPTGNYSNINFINGEWDLKKTSLIQAGNNREVYIRKTSLPDAAVSAAVKLIIPCRRPSPDNAVNFIYNDSTTDDTQALLTNIDTQMELRAGETNVWTPCTGERMIVQIPVKNTTYYFRAKATDSEFASSAKMVVLNTFGSEPGCSVYWSAEYIQSLSKYMEYKVNDGKYQPVGDMKVFPLTEIVDSLSKDETYTLAFRYMRTESKPASKTRIITIHSRPAPPKGVQYNVSTYILSGVTNNMEFREKGTDKWTSIGGTQLNLKSYVMNRPYNVQIELRYGASTSAASYPITINLYND